MEEDNESVDSDNSDEYVKNDKYDNKSVKNFIHFSTIEECNEFALFVSKMNIKVGHKCCGGKGLSINKESSFIKNLKENFKLNNIVKIDQCDICFENKSLIRKCFVCKYPFCVDCYSKIVNSCCPYCRGNI